MDSFPDDRLVLLVQQTELRDSGTIDCGDAVAVHADRYCWNPGIPACFDTGVTISTVDAEITRMLLMRKVNRLCRFVPDGSTYGVGDDSREENSHENDSDYDR
jgi:hypothetical protein